MRMITVGTKNQIVIPLEVRKKIGGILPGRKVAVYALSEDTLAIRTSSISWLDRAAGVMSGIWKTEVIKNLESSREAWDER
jgi:AbrB family looped-hinge helix DNA binding protein